MIALFCFALQILRVSWNRPVTVVRVSKIKKLVNIAFTEPDICCKPRLQFPFDKVPIYWIRIKEEGQKYNIKSGTFHLWRGRKGAERKPYLLIQSAVNERISTRIRNKNFIEP